MKKAEVIDNEIQEVKKVIRETDDARRRNEGAYSKESTLQRRYWKIREEIEQLDSYKGNKELQKIVKKIIDANEKDYDNFNFLKRAKANFSSYGKKGRELHVEIICSQVCDHAVTKVLESAEKVTGRKVSDWFISASIGYNPSEDAKAWLTYHLTFKGEDLPKSKGISK